MAFYQVTLTATNACGSDTYTLEVVVNTVIAPIAAFSYDLNQGCAPLEVQFTDESQNDATSWLWTFPGGAPATSTDPNPVVVYSMAGIYDVILEVTNSAGTDQLTEASLIMVEDLPTAGFTFSVNGSTVTFNNLSSAAIGYLWDFGDGQTSTAISPVHTYAVEGAYSVLLTVSNDCGTDTFILQVNISNQQVPQANFTLDQNRGCAPLEVRFTDLSANDVTSWLWTFPGGMPATSTEQHPVVLYSQPGQYDVRLVASNANGSDELLLENIIQVELAPIPGFNFTQNDYTFDFTNTSQNAQDYTWNFGDGSPLSNAVDPSHTYTADGTYQVILTASNNFCSAITSQAVSVYLSDVEEPATLINWQLWPNPARGVLWTSVEGLEAPALLSVYDNQGRLLTKRTIDPSSQKVLEFPNWAAGLYYWHLQTAEQVLVKKVVILER